MLGTDLASTPEQVTKRTQGDVAESSMAASSRLLVQGEDETMAIPYSRGALRDWILEQYEGTGLTRKLSELDLKVSRVEGALLQNNCTQGTCITMHSYA